MKTTVIWEARGGRYFLCRILRFGRSTDELKIIVTDPDSRMGAIYTEGRGRFTGDELVALQAELTYHADGTVLLKLPSYGANSPTAYRNPSGQGVRRVALADIREPEPFARYTVVKAIPYERDLADEVMVLPKSPLFSGDPFQCTFWLAPRGVSAPPQPGPCLECLDLCLPAVTASLDLLLRVEASSYRGEIMRLPNTGSPLVLCNNILQVVQYQTPVQPN